MKNYLFTIGVLILLSSCIPNGGNGKYVPKYANIWRKVEQEILSTWTHSKVDSSVRQAPGSLILPKSYFSIQENRNVLFGWDTYFTNAGLLLVDSFAVYAKNAVENQFAEIEQAGYVPNSSEPWAFNRAQTPFLSMMVKEVYENGMADKDWLKKAYNILLQDYHFWTDTSPSAIEDHTTSIDGLQRFGQHATNEELIRFYGIIAPRFGFSGSIPDIEKIEIGKAWMAEAESGMDFTPRFENRCTDFIPVDLNSNLYMYEKNFAWMVKELGLTGEPDWDRKATKRKELMDRYCWDEERGLFMDYDFVNKRFSKQESVAGYYTMWAGLASNQQAARMVQNLPLFEYEFGPTICPKAEYKRLYQWNYPAGWPPIYYLLIVALDNYKYQQDALRIATKYLDIVSKNFLDPQPKVFTLNNRGAEEKKERTPGHVYEKYNVVDGTIYDPEYPSRPFHGWSYGVYIWSLNYVREQGAMN